MSPRILWGEASESQSVSQSLPQRLLGEGLRHQAWPSEPYWGKPHEVSLCPGAPRQSLIPDLVKKLACVPKPDWGKPQETDLVREPSWGILRRPACVPEPPSEVYRGKPLEFTLGCRALLGQSSRGQPVSQSPPPEPSCGKRQEAGLCPRDFLGKPQNADVLPEPPWGKPQEASLDPRTLLAKLSKASLNANHNVI